tara:strand:+ start:171 stop:731 length:561 start_codon:yes stop_codon:yes gene_type:complete
MKLFRVKSKKGITPIIAIILLMMMTVAAAGAAFFWVLRLQSSFTGSSEQFGDSLNEYLNSQILVDLAQYEGDATENGGNLTLVISNVGSQPIPMDSGSSSPTTTLLLKDKDQKLICSTQNVNSSSDASAVSGFGSDLGVSAKKTLVMNLTSGCLINVTTYPVGTLFYFDIDFSGQASTGGTFKNIV